MSVFKSQERINRKIFYVIFMATMMLSSCGIARETDQITADQLRFANGTLDGWEVEGDNVWSVTPQDEQGFNKVVPIVWTETPSS